MKGGGKEEGIPVVGQTNKIIKAQAVGIIESEVLEQWGKAR